MNEDFTDFLAALIDAGDTAWPPRQVQTVGSLEVPFLGRADLIMNKKAAGRRKNLADLEGLGALE